MKLALIPKVALANWRSIRWRLPWSYAGIALLSALALGGLLLFTLNRYYTRLETQYLERTAQGLARQVALMNRDGLTTADIQSAVNLLSILTRARVQLYDPATVLVADSGPIREQGQISFGFERRVPDEVGGAVDTVRGIGPIVIMRSESEPPSSFVQQQTVPAPLAQDGLLGSYLVPVPRGPFGQLSLESTSPGDYSDARVSVPIYDSAGTLLAHLELSEGPAFGSEIVNAVAENSILAGVVAVLIAALAGSLISRSISQPVLALADAARKMEQGNLAIRSRVERRDEFGTLAETFNAMASQIETTVATLRQFVADAAHEINTPLTALRTNLELTTGSDIPDAARADLEKALAELARLDALTSNLLTLTRLENPLAASQRAPVDLSNLLRQMSERYASRAEQAAINFTVEAPAEPVIVQADPSQITRVFDNLLDNALKFTPGGGQITLGLRADATKARLWVQDSGIGIPAGDMPRLFSRFHRGRNVAAFPGNGLGLSIVKAVVDDHGGHIEVTSGEQGTCFTVSLPLDRLLPKNKEDET